MQKTTEKVLLTKAQAEALENALECCVNKSAIVENHITGLWSGARKPLMELSLETLLVALYMGYEAEPSPEEKIKEYFDAHKNLEKQMYHFGVLNGICKTLEFLNIKISGVNDNEF